MVVDIGDIADFPGQPGQRPTPGVPTPEAPVAVILVSTALDRGYSSLPVNRAAVDTFIAAELAAGRAHTAEVVRWSPWSSLQLQLGFAEAVAFNYARITIGERQWYGFLDAEYLNLTDTAYRVTPDDWTTYQPTIGYSTVLRSHVAVAASAAGDISYCLEPEPLPPANLIGYASYPIDPLGTPRVLVVSTTDLTADPFVEVDDDVADTVYDYIGQTLASGTIEAPQPLVDPVSFGYALGNAAYDDLFYYPYGGAEVPFDGYFWPFGPSTWNTNNGRPQDGFRTATRPTHTGFDMGFGVANIEGAGVYAVKAGTVTHAGFDSTFGWRVDIDHGDGYSTGYSHLYATPLVDVGDVVQVGDLLGGTGETGAATGVHLHFSVYQFSISDYIDPFVFMSIRNPGNLVVGDDAPTAGRTMYRPRAVGATPSLIDGLIAEGGAFVYPSIAAALSHLSRLAHAPWMADGIQRAILIPGGAAGTPDTVDLSPRDTVPGFEGAPVYHAALTTEIGSTITVAADWETGLPAAYTQWTKLRTGPYSAIQLADRLGGVSEFDPQDITGLDALRIRVEGVFHPTADVAAWVLGAGGTTAPATPLPIPLGATAPYWAVGRDSTLAGQAAGIAAERSQSIVDMLLALQRGNLDNTMTVASAFTATQFAIVEAV